MPDQRMVVISAELFQSTVDEYEQMLKDVEGERDRARALAARLEEVVAMRTAVLKALVNYAHDTAPDNGGWNELVAWAEAQLSEVP